MGAGVLRLNSDKMWEYHNLCLEKKNYEIMFGFVVVFWWGLFEFLIWEYSYNVIGYRPLFSNYLFEILKYEGDMRKVFF